MDIGDISQDNTLFSNNSNPLFVFNQASQAREHTISLNKIIVGGVLCTLVGAAAACLIVLGMIRPQNTVDRKNDDKEVVDFVSEDADTEGNEIVNSVKKEADRDGSEVVSLIDSDSVSDTTVSEESDFVYVNNGSEIQINGYTGRGDTLLFRIKSKAQLLQELQQMHFGEQLILQVLFFQNT